MKRQPIPQTKQEILYAKLYQQLVKGKLQLGEQIPAERKLAEKMGISYMTARGAIQMLVDEGLLLKRDRVGTFVPLDIEKRLALPRINGFVDARQAPLNTAFIDQLTQGVHKKKLFGNLLKIGDNKREMDQAIRMLKQHDVPGVVMMSHHVRNRELGASILGHSQVMLVGYDLSAMGIASVLCDDAAAARMATTLLQEQGHEEIAFLASDRTSPVVQQMISGYESCLPGKARLWLLPQSAKSIAHRVEKLVSEHLHVGGLLCTAIVCSDTQTANALAAVLREFGVGVPKQISLVTLGLGTEVNITHPKLTRIDPQLQKQVNYAIDSCVRWMQNKPVELLHKVSPKLVRGNSIAKH